MGDTLTPNVAARYAAAFAAVLPPGPVVVARDGRANGVELVSPVVAGLSQDGGRQVLDGGIVAIEERGGSDDADLVFGLVGRSVDKGHRAKIPVKE